MWARERFIISWVSSLSKKKEIFYPLKVIFVDSLATLSTFEQMRHIFSVKNRVEQKKIDDNVLMSSILASISSNLINHKLNKKQFRALSFWSGDFSAFSSTSWHNRITSLLWFSYWTIKRCLTFQTTSNLEKINANALTSKRVNFWMVRRAWKNKQQNLS